MQQVNQMLIFWSPPCSGHKKRLPVILLHHSSDQRLGSLTVPRALKTSGMNTTNVPPSAKAVFFGSSTIFSEQHGFAKVLPMDSSLQKGNFAWKFRSMPDGTSRTLDPMVLFIQTRSLQASGKTVNEFRLPAHKAGRVFKRQSYTLQYLLFVRATFNCWSNSS